jgi:hypothetical protein
LVKGYIWWKDKGLIKGNYEEPEVEVWKMKVGSQ